jgi:ABC-type sulfate/molybdate transport systems ATPase subunit
VEAAVLEFALEARREGFRLHAEGRFASDWTVIFGPSGAGKSTLLRLLAGLQRPHRGHIRFGSEPLYDDARRIHHKPGGRKIAMVAQQPALFPHMSVRGNIGYGLFALGAEERSRRVEEMLALVDASALADRRPRDLSGGEAQRVALARALAPLPRLLLLDEPFSALDGLASDALMAGLHAWLRSHQVQTVLVTHDATDAYASNAEVALMQEGKIVAIGSPAVVLETERRRILTRLGDQ